MSALVVMLLLGFLLVIAASLTIWAALTLNDRPSASEPALEQELVPRPRERRPSNDEVRGARARVTRRADASDDAFERYLRSDAKRDDAEF